MRYDLILVGGGLANGLLAIRLAQRRPELSVAIVEAGAAIGRDHIWSSFDHDVESAQRDWTDPFVAHHWDEYSVRFPGGERRFDAGYRTVSSADLAAAVHAALPGERILRGTPVVELDAGSVTLAGGRVLTAGAVIDGRGLDRDHPLDLRWQKFVGLECELEAEHGLAGPIVMDATVTQADGYRFVYTLPFAPRRLLIEDTYFSDDHVLENDVVRERALRYAEGQGWRIARVVRSEAGVLPMALGGDAADLWSASPPGVALVGLRAGLFQPATGYSFPDAVRTADLIAGLDDLSGASIYRAQRHHSISVWRARRFYRYLNALMFLGAKPDERYRVIERFYRLPPGLVHRFYAGQSTALDKARILIGKPPIPIGRAVAITATRLAGAGRR
ncbi:lycopene beta-cyclase CrtY [Sphingomonas sp. RS6]